MHSPESFRHVELLYKQVKYECGLAQMTGASSRWARASRDRVPHMCEMPRWRDYKRVSGSNDAPCFALPPPRRAREARTTSTNIFGRAIQLPFHPILLSLSSTLPSSTTPNDPRVS